MTNFNPDVLSRLQRAQSGEASNVAELRAAARKTANPYEGVGGVNEWGTNLTNADGGGLLGYIDDATGTPVYDASGKKTTYNAARRRVLGKPKVETDVSKLRPYYGIKSFTNTTDMWTNSDIQRYLGSASYKNDQNYQENFKRRSEKYSKSRGRLNAFAGLVAAGAGAGILSSIGGIGAGVSAGSATAAVAPTSSALLAAPVSSAATAGIGSAGLSFATGAAAKGAALSGISGFVRSGGDLSAGLKAAAIGGLTGGYGGSIAGNFGITSKLGTEAFIGGLSGVSQGLVSGDGIVDSLKQGAISAGTGAAMSFASDALARPTTTENGIPIPQTKPDRLSRVSRGLLNTGSGSGVSLSTLSKIAPIASMAAPYLGLNKSKEEEAPALGGISASNEQPSDAGISDPTEEPEEIQTASSDYRDDSNVLSGGSFRGSRYANF